MSLSIRIAKGRNGPNVLTCTRPDGTSTWAKVQDYFPIHDITHFVVETILCIPDAFYSLVLAGWDIESFAEKGASQRFPPQANLVEALVGRLQRDLLPDPVYTVESFNEEVESVLDGIGNTQRRPVTQEELTLMRLRLREIVGQWSALGPGESLNLTFHPVAPALRG